MGPLIKGLLVTAALLLGGLVLTGMVGGALEMRAERQVDQAYSPTAEQAASSPTAEEPASRR